MRLQLSINRLQERNIHAVFNAFDLTRAGTITRDQYTKGTSSNACICASRSYMPRLHTSSDTRTGMASLGIDAFELQPEGSDINKITLATFTAEWLTATRLDADH